MIPTTPPTRTEQELEEPMPTYIRQRPHWWYFIRHIIRAFVAVAWSVAVAVLLNPTFGLWAAVVSLVVIAAGSLPSMIRWFSTTLTITERSITYRTRVGRLFALQTPKVDISDIQTIDVSAGTPFEELAGSGDLLIATASQTEPIRFADIRRAEQVRDFIYELKRGLELGVGPPEGLVPLVEEGEVEVLPGQAELRAVVVASLVVSVLGLVAMFMGSLWFGLVFVVVGLLLAGSVVVGVVRAG